MYSYMQVNMGLSKLTQSCSTRTTVHVLLYCVSASQFPFYIYCYIYTVKLVKFVYSWPFPILNEYKMAAFHSIEKQVHRA